MAGGSPTAVGERPSTSARRSELHRRLDGKPRERPTRGSRAPGRGSLRAVKAVPPRRIAADCSILSLSGYRYCSPARAFPAMSGHPTRARYGQPDETAPLTEVPPSRLKSALRWFRGRAAGTASALARLCARAFAGATASFAGGRRDPQPVTGKGRRQVLEQARD